MIRLPALTPLEHLAFVAAGLLTYIVVTRVRRQRRHPYAALAWVIGIAAFPYLGLPLFLAFGTRKLVRPHTQREPAPAGPWAALAPLWATRLLASLGVTWSDTAAIGDDWPDLPLLLRAGFACAPPSSCTCVASPLTRARRAVAVVVCCASPQARICTWSISTVSLSG